MAPDDDDRPAGSGDPRDGTPKQDQTVKELIDAATRAELERWFSLPSFGQLENQPADQAPTEDPDVAAVRARREKAIAAVDPAMLEAHRRRVEAPESLIQFQARIDVRIDPDIALLDLAMVESRIAEPREVEISEQLRDDLKDCTPQAILRDLHRPEIDFEKVFEVVDMAAEQRFDIVLAVNEAMTTNWKLETDDLTSFREGRQLLLQLRADRFQPMTEFLQTLPNRRISE